MSSDMRVCPFCQMLIDIDACQKVMVITSTGKTSMYNSEDALQARITELEETIEDIKELAELASVDAKTLQSALFHLSTIGIIANKAVKESENENLS